MKIEPLWQTHCKVSEEKTNGSPNSSNVEIVNQCKKSWSSHRLNQYDKNWKKSILLQGLLEFAFTLLEIKYLLVKYSGHVLHGALGVICKQWIVEHYIKN